MSEQLKLIARVEEGQQAIVVVLLAKNQDGAPIVDSQLELAINMAKNVLQMAGAEVAASGSAIRFDATATGEIARLTATLDTVAESTIETGGEEEPVETDDVE